MKRQEKDVRVKSKYYTWKEFFLTYTILLTLSAGQSLIFAEFMNIQGLTQLSLEYALGMFGYWAIVSTVFIVFVAFQKNRTFDRPMRKLSEAAKQVAEGDFSIYLEPIHTADKANYIDVMFADFNRMVEELGSIETLKNDFVANVSHEMKTPLSIIQSYAMALRKENLPQEQREEYIATIITSAKNLTALVTNILRLSKLGNQEILPASEPFNLCRQLGESILSFESLLEEKQIEFEAEIDDYVSVRADSGMLEIVWDNLLSNAIKFTDPGGKIRLVQTSEEDAAIVTISDTGCGMDNNTMRRIFDQFYQGDTSHSGEGNGLGLALVRRVVDLVDGTITVTSTPGHGTTFTVRLHDRYCKWCRYPHHGT